MFGYVQVDQPELKIREFQTYRAYYCGLCRSLKGKYGIKGQITLSFDLTFVVLLLTGLYEPEEKREWKRCEVHPLRRRLHIQNRFSKYAADMNLLLTYFKMEDDWSDDHSLPAHCFAGLLKKQCCKVAKAYPEKAERIKDLLRQISHLEAEGDTNPDHISGLFGDMMAEIFVYKKDPWENALRRMGFYLGKYIYLLDAYDDLEKDLRKGSYNPLLSRSLKDPDFDQWCETTLVMMMAECSKSFELLPILENAGILRNILYSGVWTRYRMIKKKRDKDRKEKEQAANV